MIVSPLLFLLSVGVCADAQKFVPTTKVSGYLQLRLDTLGSDGAPFNSNGSGGSGVRPGTGGPMVGGPQAGFMVRRGRIRFDMDTSPTQTVVAQLDIPSGSGTNIRDAYVVWKFPGQNLALTAGQFVQPWGQEIRYSSRLRESAERALGFCDSTFAIQMYKSSTSPTGGVITPGSTVPFLINQDRDQGFQVQHNIPAAKSRPTSVTLGWFNGEGRDSAGSRNLNGVMDLVGRFQTVIPVNHMDITAGTSVYSGAMAARMGAPVGGVVQPFTNGARQLIGADAQWVNKTGTEVRIEGFTGRFELTPDRAQYLPGNHAWAWYAVWKQPIGHNQHFFLKFDDFRPVAAGNRIVGGVKGSDLERKVLSVGFVNRVQPNTFWRNTIQHGLNPYDPSATDGMRSRVTVISTELQVEF